MSGRATGGFRLSLQNMLVRLTLVSSDTVLSGQGDCHNVQSFKRHLLRFAEIDPVERSFTPAVGSPIPATTLIARLLFASGEGPERTPKGEGASCAQPAIPGWRSHRQPAVLPVSLVDQGIILYYRNSGVVVPHAYHQMLPTQ